MPSLMGGETFSIDSKGRVKLPARILRQVSKEAENTFVITRGLDGCIACYPLNEWKAIEQKLRALNQFEEKNRSFIRHLLMLSEEVTLDGQQRINLPKKLLEYADITDEVKIVGVFDRIEFWNPKRYEEYIQKHFGEFEKTAEEVMTSVK